MKKRVAAIFVTVIISLMLSACVSRDALTVIRQINALGEVTLESGPDLDAALEAYSNLSKREKIFVTNIDVLLEKTKELEELEELQRAEEEQKAVEERIRQAEQAIEQIKILPADTYEGIKNAKETVMELPEEERKKVSNLALLTEAEENYINYVENCFRGYMEQYETSVALEFLEGLDTEIIEKERDTLRESLDDYCLAVIADEDGSYMPPEDSAFLLRGLTKPVLGMYRLLEIPETDGYVKFLTEFDGIQQEYIDWRHYQEFYEIWGPDFLLIYSKFTSAVNDGDVTKAYEAANEMSQLAMEGKNVGLELDFKYLKEYIRTLVDMNIAMKLVLSNLEMQDEGGYQEAVDRMLEVVADQEKILQKRLDFLDREAAFFDAEEDFLKVIS